jgi:DNA repair protein RadC
MRALYLDGKLRLVRDALITEGTVDEAPLYPREIIRRALDCAATGIILVHNHPSGDAYPSAADVEATARLALSARHLGITLHDHLIVARSGWSSFRRMGLL